MENVELKNKLSGNINVDCSKKNFSFVLSGRTAIDAAIKDILKKRKVEKVLLPSYICESMIIPFIINKIPIEFYRVDYYPSWNQFVIDYRKLLQTRNSIVLLCDYFVPNSIHKYIEYIDGSNVIIHDVTHTLFSDKLSVEQDDYTICSLRKWFDIPDGGLIISSGIDLKSEKENIEYISNKLKSKELKRVFQDNPTEENRKQYKKFYNLADHILDEDFGGYGMSSISMDKLNGLDLSRYFKERKELLMQIREFLLKRDVKIVFNGSSLFTIPIIVEGDRNKLLERLRENGVRCTVFWEYNSYNRNIPNYLTDNSICLDISQNTLQKINSKMKRGY